MKDRLFFADSSFKSEIEMLRQSEYSKAKGFVVDPAALQWKASDDESYVMAAMSGAKLISTMRGEVIRDASLLERKLECSWQFPLHLSWPVLLLSRAATLSTHREQGLNLTMRYWFLKFARNHKIPFVVGTFISGSPRARTLLEMGYEFFENTQGWQESTYRSLAPVTVAVLDMNRNGEQAMEYCELKNKEEILRFHLDAFDADLKYVGCL